MALSHVGKTFELVCGLLLTAPEAGPGPFLVAGLPRHKGILGRLLAGLPSADTCQSTTNLVKVSGGTAGPVTPCCPNVTQSKHVQVRHLYLNIVQCMSILSCGRDVTERRLDAILAFACCKRGPAEKSA